MLFEIKVIVSAHRHKQFYRVGNKLWKKYSRHISTCTPNILPFLSPALNPPYTSIMSGGRPLVLAITSQVFQVQFAEHTVSFPVILKREYFKQVFELLLLHLLIKQVFKLILLHLPLPVRSTSSILCC